LGKQHDSGDRGRRDTPVLNREDESPLRPEMTIAPGQLVDDRFKILSLLGKGGMGSVYLVLDILSGKRLAMKTISAETSARSVRRFELEAKATSLLDHPNLDVYKRQGVEGSDDGTDGHTGDFTDGHVRLLQSFQNADVFETLDATGSEHELDIGRGQS